MGRVSKVARGKHRWIGVRGDKRYESRGELMDIISDILEQCEWRLYDVRFIDQMCFFIIKTQLQDYEKSLNLINSHNSFETLTSSGKINRIRERIF
ncbi:MAG: hypothetical protein CMB08_04245 [Euryarchaeota archaeon]|nr:hypothetical protein [Euryarchaeota archaeon]|tara:strand:+ start:320 stop:607 length:288 start_codon:yes stop_codon:yes gene_type:complete